MRMLRRVSAGAVLLLLLAGPWASPAWAGPPARSALGPLEELLEALRALWDGSWERPGLLEDPAHWSKEGSAVDPHGQPAPPAGSWPAGLASPDKAGSAIDPHGHPAPSSSSSPTGSGP